MYIYIDIYMNDIHIHIRTYAQSCLKALHVPMLSSMLVAGANSACPVVSAHADCSASQKFETSARRVLRF